jgi:hypothetical protein
VVAGMLAESLARDPWKGKGFGTERAGNARDRTDTRLKERGWRY